MVIAAGTRLGPYEILTMLGAGGMGEVYRARDTRLDRSVAIKILPVELRSSDERRARLEREARAIAALQHPHICALHDIGRDGDVDYLVMEYLEGETLSQRLLRGPLPLEQTLRVGTELALALGAAHQRGIVHRDVKPQNVMLTRAGAKLLDFGLAKPARVLAPAEGPTRSGHETDPDVLTGKGSIVGTLQYMAPEQLEGREADARTDIFALGALLFEMTTGRRAFSGSTPASVIAAIISSQPPRLSTILPLVPSALEHVVSTCLTKDPDERWQSASDLARELRWISQPSAEATAIPHRRSKGRVAARLGGAALAALAAFFAGLALSRAPYDAGGVGTVRFDVTVPEGAGLVEHVALSPDGRYLAVQTLSRTGDTHLGILGGLDDRPQIWLRPLAGSELRPVLEAAGGRHPFFSPDGRWLAFFADGKLKKLSLSGGGAQVICDGNGPGGTWGRDGTIVFAPSWQSGLSRVSAEAGQPAPVTELSKSRDEYSHRFPYMLPDGRSFLYVAMSKRAEESGVLLGSLHAREGRPVVKAGFPAAFLPPGNLLYVRAGVLFGQPVVGERLEVREDPTVLAEQIDQAPSAGWASVATAAAGVLAYRAWTRSEQTELTFFDRDGNTLPPPMPPAFDHEARLSPDATRLAVERFDTKTQVRDVWVIEIARGVASRLTFGPSLQICPIWSPDGRRLAYSSSRLGRFGLYEKSVSAAGEERLLLAPGPARCPTDWSRDGRFLIYEERVEEEPDLFVLPLSGERKPIPLAATRFYEGQAVFSPDGRFVALTSRESGAREVYVQSFPSGSGRWRVSTNGGTEPRWRSDGRELFYLGADDRVMAVQVGGHHEPEFSLPNALGVKARRLTDNRNHYDVSGDGKRFLVNRLVDERRPSLVTVIVNWRPQPAASGPSGRAGN